MATTGLRQQSEIVIKQLTSFITKGDTMFEWLLTALSLAGTWFNIQKKVVSWVIWSFANCGWVISFIHKGMVAEATLFAVYLVLSIYGFIKWKRLETRRAERTT
jgi:nicotinamide mononucleotide transporter